MRELVFFFAVAVTIGIVISANAAAASSKEECVDFTELDEAMVVIYWNYTGDDASEMRQFIDEMYDSDDYWGDGQVTQDEVDKLEDAWTTSMEDNGFEYTLNGQENECDDVDIKVQNALGETDSTANLVIKFEFTMSFDDIDSEDIDFVFFRDDQFWHYMEPETDVDIAVTAPSDTKIMEVYGLEKPDLTERTVSGGLEMENTLTLVFTIDNDYDGYLNPDDAFPNDPTEWADDDRDGYGNNCDTFPTDASEWNDTDADGVGDNSDAFPKNSQETKDTDKDGVGDKSDAFPTAFNETKDTDKDGHGDNGDEFPYDPTEWVDTDNDGIGDNSDPFPQDPAASMDSDNDGAPDAFNPGYTEKDTPLRIDHQPHNPSTSSVKENPMNGMLFIGTIIFAILTLVFMIVIIVLIVLLVLKGKKKSGDRQGPPGTASAASQPSNPPPPGSPPPQQGYPGPPSQGPPPGYKPYPGLQPNQQYPQLPPGRQQ